MTLLCDDINGIYVWIGDNDYEIVELSPHFDYEEDALAWRANQDIKSNEQ